VGGRLGEAELKRLESCLADSRPALVAVHHPPLALGTPWMDAIGLENGAQLLERLGRHPQARALLFGHAHCEFDAERGGLRLLGCPSTCLQFAMGTAELELDPRPPGYRWLRDTTGGGIDTGVVRVP
jgi:Icc protein